MESIISGSGVSKKSPKSTYKWEEFLATYLTSKFVQSITVEELLNQLPDKGNSIDSDFKVDPIRAVLNTLARCGIIRKYTPNEFGSLKQLTETAYKPLISQKPGKLFTPEASWEPLPDDDLKSQQAPKPSDTLQAAVDHYMHELVVKQKLFIIELVIQKRVQAELDGQLIPIGEVGLCMHNFAVAEGLVKWKCNRTFTGQGTGYSLNTVKPPDSSWYMAS